MNEKFSFDKDHRSRSIFKIFSALFFTLILLITIIPMYKVLVDSLDKGVTYGLAFWPSHFSLDTYKLILTTDSLRQPLAVSIYITIIGSLFGLTLCTLGAYVLIQFDMPGRTLFSYLLLITMMFDGGLVPTYLVMRNLGLLNSLWAIIFPLSMNVYNLILMRNFFEGIPASLYESAELDGCTPMGIFWKIVLPLSKPALASIGLFYAVAFWNEYTRFTIYISDQALFNFQTRLRALIIDNDSMSQAAYQGINAKALQNAAIIVGLLPMAILYPFCQKYFVTGVTMGAVKE